MISVVGATGTLGGRIVRGLLEKDKAVRILVRENSPSIELAKMGLATSPDSLIAAGASAVTGDLTDRASLDAVCEGIHTLITTANSIKRGAGEQLETVDLQGTLNLIEAAKAAGVEHFIYTSVYGSDLNSSNRFVQIKATCEQALKQSGMTWTILNPGVFPEIWAGMVIGIPLQAGQPITLIGQGDHRHSLISEADVAAFAVAAVDNPASRNVHIEIGGPSVSWTEIVKTAGEAMGMALPVNYLPLDSSVPLLDPMVGEFFNGMETYESFINMGETGSLYGVELTPLPAVMQQMFGQEMKVP